MLRKLSLLFAALLLGSALVLFGWYQVDGIPIQETARYVQGDGFEFTEEPDGSLVFRPANPSGNGLLIMHGALIKPRSYAKTAAWFAELGYLVYIPAGPGRLSIGAVDSAGARMADFGLDNWFLIGHSMGGMASLELVSKYGDQVRAAALWASAIPSDYKRLDLPVLYIRGDNDGLLPPERFRQSRANLPDSVEYVMLEGANHRNFAMYSHQFFDNEATIDWLEQIDFANRVTAQFFAEQL